MIPANSVRVPPYEQTRFGVVHCAFISLPLQATPKEFPGHVPQHLLGKQRTVRW
jgi:hypothetical protein